MIATGLPFSGASPAEVLRESQSSAFFSGPGTEALYSGVTTSTASAARTAAPARSTGSGHGSTSRSWLNSGSSPIGTSPIFSAAGAWAIAAFISLRFQESRRSEPQIAAIE